MKRLLGRVAARSALAALSAAACLGLFEAVLAAQGEKPHWTYTSGWADDDLEARYKLKPGVYTGLDVVAMRINSYGARGPEPRRPVMLNLGDSCAYGIGLREEETYSGLMTARGFEAVNAGVPGYDSYNGLRNLENSRYLSLHPKLVTLYFGWNDHWSGIATERAFARVRALARYSRVASRLLLLQQNLSGRWPEYRWVNRVPLAQFKDNLREMIAESRSAGAAVVLITPPSELRMLRGRTIVPASHTAAEWEEHARYVEAVRQVADETGAGLVDLEREMRRRSTPDRREYFFDAVHLNRKGNRVLADLLVPWARSAAAAR